MCKYDVFLSFRGEDTRTNFTDHLYAALNQQGINVFRDNEELERGKAISSELLKAIEESKISVIVFSRNYASSTWCLDELVKIVECMNTMEKNVIPIFYDVDPSVVRKQTGVFGEVFAQHEETFREKKQRVQTWKNALTKVANLSGFHLKDRHESEFIKEIIKDINSKLGRKISTTSEDLVGINPRIEELRLLIDIEAANIRMIGICGMGGIGKTTIARVVFELIDHKFEGSAFLADVREISLQKGGLVSLQKQLLSKALGQKYDHFEHINNVFDGKCELERRLICKKVLIIVDDVDNEKQLNALVGKPYWFGSGSRIIITTRNKHLLKTHGVDEVYEAEKLCDDEALQLLISKAFKNHQPAKYYEELSKLVVEYAAGLPLALKVLGSFLFGKTVDQWKDALERLKSDFDKGIFDILKISFDGLEIKEQQIFLDIACFFKGKNEEYVTRILDSCGFNPIIGIKVLVDKSLITISEYNTLLMHDLLQEMGQQIVKSESPNEPGNRSRLWKEADIHHVLAKNTGSEVIEGIMLSSFKKEVCCSPEAFSKMRNLRLLKICNVQLPNGLEYLSDELRLLDWADYPLQYLPNNMKLDKVVELNFQRSHIKQLSKETKAFNPMTIINFRDCQYLERTPNFAGAPNLDSVSFEGCKRLKEIHPSFLMHKKIAFLNLNSCTSLATLPDKIHMESLRILELDFCAKLKFFPEIVGRMDRLSSLHLTGTAIKELPLSVEFLTGLEWLNLRNSKNLRSLPFSINGLKSLLTLDLGGCARLENPRNTLTQLESLWNLDLRGTAVRRAMSSIFLKKKLNIFSFDGCEGSSSNPLPIRSSDTMAFTLPPLSGLFSPLEELRLNNCNLDAETIPSDFFGSFSSLKKLDLSNNNFVSLPKSINCLSKLETLTVDGCTSLMTLSNASRLCSLKLSEISCKNCFKLMGNNNMQFSMLKEHVNKVVLRNKFNFLERLRQFQGRNRDGISLVVPGNEFPEWYSDWAVDRLSYKYPLFKQLHELNIENYEFGKFRMVVPGSEIPEWFSHKFEDLGHFGCLLTMRKGIKRPPYIYNNSKLVGCLVCIVLDLQGKNDSCCISCVSGSVEFLGVNFDIEEVSEVVSEHLVILFFPPEAVDLPQNTESVDFDDRYGNGSWFSLHYNYDFDDFDYYYSGRYDDVSDAKERLKRWGVHMVYEEDVKEINKINGHSSWWNWKPFHEDDDVGSSKRRSCYDEGPKRKRSKLIDFFSKG